jgi:hypothetical protein
LIRTKAITAIDLEALYAYNIQRRGGEADFGAIDPLTAIVRAVAH